jgi:UDP-N-acetylmuramoyl-L-alanyl-D-glutamate--2,6-diaminopimelate ligase
MSVGETQNGMLLSELLGDLVNVDACKDVRVTGISEYSGDVENGDLFIANSGLEYAHEAIANGAAAIVYQTSMSIENAQLDCAVPRFACDNLTDHIVEIVTRFYGEIDNNIRTIAITGTDGKSSVAHLVAQALEKSREACGLIGTLGYGLLANLAVTTHTTPPVSRIAREYLKFNQLECTAVAIEASSHGIQQKRLQNLSIHTAVLTNVTRDHLDYHKSVDEYIQAKAALFFSGQPKHAVINIDDATGCQWSEQLTSLLNVITFSMANVDADVYARDVKYLSDATVMQLSIRQELIAVKVPLLGQFNVLNVLAVAAVLVSLDKSAQEINEALNSLQAVPGRMQVVPSQIGAVVIVDYAHTPAALFAALNAVREHCSGKLICVFGCGGNRDAGKRSQMGEMASRYSDFAVITSDNPRNEDPQEIINQIISGCIGNDNYKVIVDREDAIVNALAMASANDAVLIAGKGHEKYQYVNNQKIAFDDVDVATQALARLANG